MRIFRIFLLHCEYVFERRALSFIWFLVMLINPLILLLYWRGALQSTDIAGWSLSSVTSYYFLLVIAGALLMSHIEEDVSEEDIAQGNLVRYMIRPFSYYWINFIREMPYRILQGLFAVMICIIFVLLFGRFFEITSDSTILLLSLFSLIFAYILSFTFKMVLGLLAFWFTDAAGFYQIMEIIVLIYAGYVIPLDLMPPLLYDSARWLPFSYMIYYPVIIIQGKVPFMEILQILSAQIIWLIFFGLLYRVLWNNGLKKFTGMGQ